MAGQEAAQDTAPGFCYSPQSQVEHFIRSKLCHVPILANVQTACSVRCCCAGCAVARRPRGFAEQGVQGCCWQSCLCVGLH